MTGLPILALAVLALVAGSAQAAPFTGTLLIQSSGFPVVSISGSGSGDPTLPSISANSFVGSSSAPVLASAPITQVFLSLTGNAAGGVGSGPTLGGAMNFRGFGIGIPLFGITIPKVGFLTSRPYDNDDAAQLYFDVWRTGLATISRTHTGMSAACTAGSATCPTAMLGGATANAIFFGGASQIVLVAPVDLHTGTGAIGGIPTFAVMSLNYVPEPGTLLMLGGGAAGVGLAGRRRQGR